MSELKLNASVAQWASKAKCGDRYTYHLGTSVEKFDEGEGKHKLRRPELREAWDMYDLGLVTLTQKLLHRDHREIGTYAYIATKL
jgi:hypothetical protein